MRGPLRLESFRQSRAAPASAIVLAFAIGPVGCAVGPDFARPTPPPASRYTRDTLHAEEDASKSDTLQHVALGREIEGNWWTLFHSEAIDQLVAQALDH